MLHVKINAVTHIRKKSLNLYRMIAQMAHFLFPYYFTIPNSEFRIPKSEFRIPKFALQISEFGIVKYMSCWQVVTTNLFRGYFKLTNKT